MAAIVPSKDVPTYRTDQSKHEHLPSVPLRAVIAGPSGSGKTQLIVSMITDLYLKNDGSSVFKRIYIWSPSIDADPAWLPVKKFVAEKLHVPHTEKWTWDHYDPKALDEVIQLQRAVIAAAKERKVRRLFSVLIVVDDFADQPAFTRRNTLHAFVSTIFATQKFRALSPLVRTNATALCVVRLRSEQELLAIVEEISAVYPKDVIISMLRRATEEPYSFLYVDLTAKTPERMFWLRFDKRLVPSGDAPER
jgi:ABC-type dipeptide/oligopeptide/nickel transport system ATPase component